MWSQRGQVRDALFLGSALLLYKRESWEKRYYNFLSL